MLFPTLAAPPAASAQTTVPAAPSGLTATAITHNKIDLTWVDNSNNETGFKIHRSLDGTVFDQIATVKADITAYRDAGLKASTWYTYTHGFNKNEFWQSTAGQRPKLVWH
jgi:hypothetical protein